MICYEFIKKKLGGLKGNNLIGHNENKFYLKNTLSISREQKHLSFH